MTSDEDLKLAAEFGNVLLRENQELKSVIEKLTAENKDLSYANQQLKQKNEELGARNELLSYEVLQKLEACNQERHVIRLQLDALRTEHLVSLSDLRHDLDNVTQKMDEERGRAGARDRLHSVTIAELSAQNERLAEELLNLSSSETEVRSALRLQVDQGSTTEEDHQREVATLTSEIEELRGEMTLRVKLKTDECSILSTALSEAVERVEALEHECTADKTNIKQLVDEQQRLEEDTRRLEDINMQLLSKLENISRSAAPGAAVVETGETSLFAELEVLSNSMAVDSFDWRSPLILAPPGGGPHKVTIGTQLKQEILEVYRQLQRLSLELRGRAVEWSPEAVDLEHLKAGQLLVMITDLRSLVYQRSGGPAPASPRLNKNRLAPVHNVVEDNPPHMDELARQISVLRDQVFKLTERLTTAQTDQSTVTAELNVRDKQLQRKHNELAQAEGKLANMMRELYELRADRDRCRDLAVGSITADDVLSQTRRERDAALERLSDAQCELTQARLDLMSLDRQLLDTVDQKLQLSRQLDDWQTDMQELIDTKMAAEIAQDRLNGRSTRGAVGGSARVGEGVTANGGSRKFSLWH